MKVVQVKLRRLDHAELLTTWVDSRPDLHVGCSITLKDFKPDNLWRVEEIYDGVHESKDFEFHRKWDNNDYSKHEGLKIT